VHERAVADAAKGRHPHLPVSCSADVVAEYREFERFSTTVLNAYLQPLMDAYLAGLSGKDRHELKRKMRKLERELPAQADGEPLRARSLTVRMRAGELTVLGR